MIEDRLESLIPNCSSPNDLPAALASGATLCKLVNKIYPGKIGTIFEDPDGTLSALKCRRNVDAFLEAARAVGVRVGTVTTAGIMERKDVKGVIACIQSLLRPPRGSLSDV